MPNNSSLDTTGEPIWLIRVIFARGDAPPSTVLLKNGRSLGRKDHARGEAHAKRCSAGGWLSACNTDCIHSSVGLLAFLMARLSAGLALVNASRVFRACIFVRL